jgi:hypothetical protein
MKKTMKRSSHLMLNITIILTLVLCSGGCQPASPTGVSQPVTPGLSATATDLPPTSTNLTPTPVDLEVPYELVSQESLFGFLKDLTSIQPYSGWRNSGSRGEAEALDYVSEKMIEFSSLTAGGMELERQSFPVYLSTEMWEAGLTLSVDGQEIKIPAEGIRGSRFSRPMALYFDSDGVANDPDPDPMTAAGAPLIVLDEDTLYSLVKDDLTGRILFLDYSLIDRITNRASGNRMGGVENTDQLITLIDQGLAGVVLVTHYSDQSGESHSTSASEGSNFYWEVPSRRVPMLIVRIEDMGGAGIGDWEDLEKITSAQMVLDIDVFSPGQSGNVIARIPGRDPSKAVILGAHIDSPNTAGALDDGSGSAALLEVARVLDASQLLPPVDVYLAWFGSEELGIYGSSYFVSTHQELLDRTLAMVQMDALGLPLEGKPTSTTMLLASYDRFGDERLLLPDFLSNTVANQKISLDAFVEHGIDSDNNNFEAFDVPNLDLVNINVSEFKRATRPIHFSSHWHDPYETVEKVLPAADAFVDMTKVMLAAALEIGRLQPNLRVTPAPTRRALIIASHTESFGITTLRELGAALSWEGFDVDLIPYGQAIRAEDLEQTDVLMLPPALNSPGRPIEVWSETEITLLQGYVADGGLLVVLNSTCEYASTICFTSRNLNARAANPLLEPMGIKFGLGGAGSDDNAMAVSEHPLTLNAPYLSLDGGNAVYFRMETGQVLFQAASLLPLVGLVDYGELDGQVLVIAETGLLRDNGASGRNIDFIKNIARYARTR